MGLGAAIAGAAVIGGVSSAISASSAAGAQKDAASQASATEQAQLNQSQAQYEQNRTDLAPYRQAGYTALGQIGTGTASGGEFDKPYTAADLQTDPGYQFRLDQGNRGIQASAAAQGGVLSGGVLKSLDAYNSGEASQEYNNAFNQYQTDLTNRYNRLASVAGIGQTATNSTIAAANANTATQQAGTTQIASNILAAGNASASQYVATGNAIGNAAGQIGQAYTLGQVGGTGGSYDAGWSSVPDASTYDLSTAPTSDVYF